jgi:signal transduction histidine kinase
MILAIVNLMSTLTGSHDWWQVSLAILLGIAFVSAIVVLTWRWRVRRLLEQRNELSLAVMLRTREIQREKLIVEEQKQQIEVLLEAAQRSNRLKDEFLANISHEIRTPLHGFMGMNALVLTTELTTEQREYLEIAEASAHSLLMLLNDILDFSKIEAGQFTLETLPFSLRECIDRAVGPFPTAARQRGLLFELHIDPDTPDVLKGDAMRIGQVVRNLLSNALKFTEAGAIKLHIFQRGHDAKCSHICFAVKDTGIGIPKDKWATILEPFRQADGSTTRKYGGTGLGLAICKRLVEQMGGELTLDSMVGKGSTFSCTLPLTILSREVPEHSTHMLQLGRR